MTTAIKTRLEHLETASAPKREPFRVVRFIDDPESVARHAKEHPEDHIIERVIVPGGYRGAYPFAWSAKPP